MSRERIALGAAWLIALLAVAGSLFFSEVWHFPPCILCWYQRICMYPLAVILGVGLWRKTKDLPLFVLPFSLTGLAISVFHNLLYYKIIPESEAPCSLGISCTTKYIEWLGFITIPFLSMVGFIAITACAVYALKQARKNGAHHG